ncbi:DegT/DnrJ/EryC1/StrS family aminotransferase [Candidatus Sumerlaeota bacterium]|nr:DegT/DnrJ/EryC1/StrS family aminotransferase [Candidatus Sumerlaeota bacterium]
MSNIPLVDLKAQYRSVRGEIDEAIRETLESAAFIMGSRVSDFERAFADFCGARFGIATSSGTTALHMALIGAGIGAGDEVITPSHTFIATAEAICHCGATPVFIDVDPETMCLDPEQIEPAITPRTKAIVPVHIWGQLADMGAICEVAQRHGLRVIEDAAQAHGAELNGRRAGTLGDFGCFSFFPGKNLGACGDGGMVTTDDEGQAHRLRLLVNHGRHTKYEHEMIGYNYRLDALQGAILSVKLRHLEEWTQARRRLARRYSERLADVDGISAPVERRGHVYHLYVIQCDDRDALARALSEEGIASGIHYPIPLHLQPCFSHLPSAGRGRFPVTERVVDRILSLPIYPEMTDEQQDRVVRVIREHLAR